MQLYVLSKHTMNENQVWTEGEKKGGNKERKKRNKKEAGGRKEGVEKE